MVKHVYFISWSRKAVRYVKLGSRSEEAMANVAGPKETVNESSPVSSQTNVYFNFNVLIYSFISFGVGEANRYTQRQRLNLENLNVYTE